MGKKYTTPITNENFLEAWNEADKKLRWAKKSFVIGKLTGTIGMLLFALCATAVVLAFVYHWGPEFYKGLFEMIPNLVPKWLEFESKHLPMGAEQKEYLVFYASIAYLPALAFAAAVTILVHLLYHPFKKKPVEGDSKKNAEMMVQNLEKARNLTIRAKANWSALVFAFYLGIVSILVVLAMFLSDSEFISTGAIENQSTARSSLNLFVVMIGIFAVFCLLNYSYILLSRCFFWCKVPYAWIADAEYYHTFAEEQTEGLSEEEIQAKRQEFAEKKLAEAMEYEKYGNYVQAKKEFVQAASTGNVLAMDHLARFLSGSDKEAAIYWYKKCLDSGEAVEGTKKRIRQLKKGHRIDVNYR